MITTDTIKACLDRAAIGEAIDTKLRLRNVYHVSAAKDLQTHVIEPLQQALAERQIDRDRWDTCMLKLKHYENLHARICSDEGMRAFLHSISTVLR